MNRNLVRSVVLSLGVLTLVGCPEGPTPAWLEIKTEDGEIVTNKEVTIAAGESVTLFAEVSPNVDTVVWTQESGQVRGNFTGYRYTNTWGEAGNTYRVVVTAYGVCAQPVTESVWVRVVAAEKSPVIGPPPLIFVSGGQMVVSGGVWQSGGTIAVTLSGGTLTLTLPTSGFFQGGTGPFTVVWLAADGTVLANGYTCQIPITQAGTFTVTLRIMDATGASISLTLTIVVTEPTPPPPPPPGGPQLTIVSPPNGATYLRTFNPLTNLLEARIDWRFEVANGTGTPPFQWKILWHDEGLITETGSSRILTGQKTSNLRTDSDNNHDLVVEVIDASGRSSGKVRSRVNIN